MALSKDFQRNPLLLLLLLLLLFHMLLVMALPYSARTVTMRSSDDAFSTASMVDALLTRAFKLSSGMIKSPKADASAPKSGPLRLKPAKLRFGAQHTQNIVMNDAYAAVQYLSLPASNYSLLDSSLVTRDNGSDNVFVLEIPLDGSNTGRVLEATLQTSVTVDPDPDKKIVKMRSGPLTFAPSSSQKGGRAEHFSTVLPEWLVWGGKSNISDSSSNNSSESDSSVIAMPEEVKASIQAGFELTLMWDKAKPLDAPSARNNPSHILATAADTDTDDDALDFEASSGSSSSTKNRGASIAMPRIFQTSDYMPVRASIRVWVEANIPLQEEIAAAINFPLVRVLVEQAGTLTAGAVLRSLGPTLAGLLVQDYDKRRLGKFQAVRSGGEGKLVD